ncbi:zinc-binding dehydrogenase [Paenibacillus zanthoxyli]|uniref:zinc-binding dehydrogenase n=1 Tax=Paenibacillus zanthoxyli TaxID=369399 RepID=UPI0004B5AC8A|nr:zinc-binding dehydrogenase [Paenibacillus zanthoxyli]
MEFVRDLGADEVLAYDLGGLNTTTEFDFMLDTLGGSSYGDALKFMKKNSVVATIISGRDAVRPDYIDAVEEERQLTVKFVFTRPDGRNMNHIRELVEAQKIKPVVAEVLPLTIDGARKAHRLSQTGRVRGKIVLSNNN